MFTVCPKCTLTLVVTTVDLRAGQGYVRCGRCANVFNALIALREGDPTGGTSDTANRRLQETQPAPPANPAMGAGVDMEPDPAPEPEPEPAPEPEPEPEPEAEPEEPLPDFEPSSGIVVESETLPEDASLEFDATATDVSEIFISPTEAEQSGSGTYESVVLGDETSAAGNEPEHEPELIADEPSHTDTIAAEDWSLLDEEPAADDESVIEESPLVLEATSDEPAFDQEGPAEEDTMNVVAPQPDPPWVEEMFAEAEAEAERVRTAEHEAIAEDFSGDEPAVVEAARASTGSAAPSDTVLEPLLQEPAPPQPAWRMYGGIAALVLLLVVQVIHFNRQSLVLNGAVGPAISKVYGWFGATPAPRWDLTAYSVKQLGAEAEGGEGTQLRVRLSLQNESQRVQPLPLLRLTLQDRYGNAVATRDLEPRDYLPPRATEQRLLEPDQRIDAELHVIDPGRAAIGFEIDACLRAESGAIGCANDARRRTAG
jgi:predicted Zn finger-like uncharacterized protein